MVQAVPQTPMAVQTVPPPITPAATSYVPRPHQLPIMPQKAWYDKTSKKLEKDTLDDEKELAKMRMLQIKLEKARCLRKWRASWRRRRPWSPRRRSSTSA